MQNRYKNHRRF